MRLAEAVDDGQDPDQEQSPGHHDIADKEDVNDEPPHDLHTGKRHRIGQSPQKLAKRQLGHNVGRCLAHQRRYRNNRIAMCSQCID